MEKIRVQSAVWEGGNYVLTLVRWKLHPTKGWRRERFMRERFDKYDDMQKCAAAHVN
jgi:hypothetical protein